MDVHKDYTLKDDSGYTNCSFCQSCLRPYHNQSSQTNNIIAINKSTKTLIKYHHLHCEKCGLYIEIHPKHSDNTTLRIFICSHSIPHKYCLCYHCGLLYGINPNQKPINNILNILSQNNNENENTKPIKHNPKDDHKHENSDEKQKEQISSKKRQTKTCCNVNVSDSDSKSDEQQMIEINQLHEDVQAKYDNLKALQDKLNALNGKNGIEYHAMSCPSSPQLTEISGFQISHQKSKSLKGSPMLNALNVASKKSPRDLSEDLKYSQQHWQKYLLQNRAYQSLSNKSNSPNEDKVVLQQKRIEELEALKLRLEQTQSKSAQYVELLKNGKYKFMELKICTNLAPNC